MQAAKLTLNVVTKNLAVALGSALSESLECEKLMSFCEATDVWKTAHLSTFAASRHVMR